VAYYLDTSALVKLVVAESETAALQSWLAADARDPVASDLVRTELLRAVRRSVPERMERAREILNSLTLLSISTPIFEQAGRLEPAAMRSLDALHLAVALELGDDLEGLVTYDDRLAEAARLQGIRVEGPA
jgi:predicted nucleic acid-binding protein